MKEISDNLRELRLKEAFLEIKSSNTKEMPVFYIKDSYEVCKKLIIAKKICNKRLVIKNEAGLFLLIIFNFDDNEEMVYPALINISNNEHEKALEYLLNNEEIHLDILNEKNEYMGTDIIDNEAKDIIEKYYKLSDGITNTEEGFQLYRCYLMEEKNLITEYLYS